MAKSRVLSQHESRDAPYRSRLFRIRALLTNKAFFPGLAIFVATYYALLLTGRKLMLWAPAISPGESAFHSTLGFVFNDMLLRLLHGDFTIDPAIIQWEAVFWDGNSYTYFGVLPALLRLVFLPFFDLTRIDVSPVCILIATTLCVLFKVAALRKIVLNRPAHETSGALGWALLAILIFSGAPVQFLKVSIYQESIMWEGVCASAFLALVMAGLVDKAGFTSRRLQLMALVAGCCLLTRVVLATGLYAAMLLLLGALYMKTAHKRQRSRIGPSILPLAILAVFAGLAGFVNAKRFGNPLVFHRPRQTLIVYPKGVPGLDNYGEFNVRRIPFGLMYYFAPIWFIHDSDGEFLLNTFKQREMDLVEPPPSSFLLTDTLLIILAASGLGAILRKRGLTVDWMPVAAIAGGLAIPPLLMLTAYAMAFRYRMEFYPLIEFLALTGGFAAVGSALRWERKSKALIALAMLGILASHAVLIAYKLSPGGSLDRSQHLPSMYFETIKQLGHKP